MTDSPPNGYLKISAQDAKNLSLDHNLFLREIYAKIHEATIRGDFEIFVDCPQEWEGPRRTPTLWRQALTELREHKGFRTFVVGDNSTQIEIEWW